LDWRCGTKFLYPVCDEPKKRHPRLRLSDWQRLASSDSVILWRLRLGKGVPILLSLQ
jgi:hypothetical protein